MKKLFTIAVLSVIACGHLSAQQQVDIVQMNSGVTVIGNITAQDSEYTTIRKNAKMNITVATPDIERIRTRDFLRKWNYAVDLGLGDLGSGGKFGGEVTFTAAYNLFHRCVVGAGAGIQYLKYCNDFGTITSSSQLNSAFGTSKSGIGVPLFADIRYYITKPQGLVLFADAKCGYRIGRSAGLYFAPSIGVVIGYNYTLGLGITTSEYYNRYIDNSGKLHEDSHTDDMLYYIRLGFKF